MKKAQKYADDVNDIWTQMPQRDKKQLLRSRYGMKNPQLISTEEAYHAVKAGSAFIKKENGTPASFLYIDPDIGDVYVATKEEYKNKGYALENMKKAKEWLDNNSDISEITFSTTVGNKAANNLAKKAGFKSEWWNDMDTTDPDFENWYTLRKNNS